MEGDHGYDCCVSIGYLSSTCRVHVGYMSSMLHVGARRVDVTTAALGDCKCARFSDSASGSDEAAQRKIMELERSS
eukprot:6195422-Pleurochrysis_carterae.AAC.3